MNILLTGASGYLGSALAVKLLADGHGLALLCRPGSDLSRLRGAESAAVVGRVAGDAQTRGFLHRVQESMPLDAVIHTACAYGRQGEGPIELLDANLRLGVLMLDTLLPVVDRLLFLNAASALPPEVGLYALGKHQFSSWGASMARQAPSRLRFVDLRLQHFYGPGDDPGKFSTHLIRSCLRDIESLDLSPGDQRRDFVHVDDVVQAFTTVLAHGATLQSVEAIDVGSGSAPSVREFVQTVHQLCGAQTRLNFGALPYRAHEPMLCCADTTRLRSMGWLPSTSLIAGLRATIDKERLP